MMDKNYNPTPIDESTFDRLVDGEISEEERRRLLAGLDDTPNGWRCCALAFLEAQCWKQVLGPMTQRKAETVPIHKPTPTRSVWHNRLGTLVAMAASFLLAFWVGSHLQQLGIDHRATSEPTAGQIALKTPSQSPSHGLGPSVESTPNPWKVVTVPSPAGSPNAGSSMQLPAVERDKIDQQWLRNLPPAMPDNVRQAFARSGHQVDEQRELMPVSLQDGRQLVVPVDNVKVHYVGNQTY